MALDKARGEVQNVQSVESNRQIKGHEINIDIYGQPTNESTSLWNNILIPSLLMNKW